MLLAVMVITQPDETNAQQATRSIDRDTLRTGDIFTYQIRIRDVESFDEVIYPDSTDFGDDFIIRDLEIRTDERGDSLIYTLQFFGVDNNTIPEMYVELLEESDTLFLVIPEASFVYESRVDDEEAELRPMKPLFPFIRNWWPWIITALVILALAGYLFYRYRDRLFAKPAPEEAPHVTIEPFRSPLDELRNELNRIEDSYSDPVSEAKSFYTELGDAFRRYFEQTHNFPALESTTGEVIRELQKLRFDDEVIRLAGLILQEADLVKFAKYQPNDSGCRDVINNSYVLAKRIAITDRYKIEELRRLHEENQEQTISEESHYDMG